jgi:hypothetical protein
VKLLVSWGGKHVLLQLGFQFFKIGAISEDFQVPSKSERVRRQLLFTTRVCNDLDIFKWLCMQKIRIVLVEGYLVNCDLIQSINSLCLFLADVKRPLLVFTSLLIDSESNNFEMIDDIEGLHIDNVTDLYELWVFSQMCQHYFWWQAITFWVCLGVQRLRVLEWGWDELQLQWGGKDQKFSLRDIVEAMVQAFCMIVPHWLNSNLCHGRKVLVKTWRQNYSWVNS